MKIFLRQISDFGLEFNQMISAEELELPKENVCCLSLLAVHGDFQRVGDEVIAKFEVRGKYRLSCVRCLEDFEIEKTDRFDLVFDIEPVTEFIEFSEGIRDEIILAANLNPHCREDCKGLCPGCGVNLNMDKCKCSTGHKMQDIRHK